MTPLVSAVIAGFAMGIYLAFKGRFGPDHPLDSGDPTTGPDVSNALDDDGAPIALRRGREQRCTPIGPAAPRSETRSTRVVSDGSESIMARRPLATLALVIATLLGNASIVLAQASTDDARPTSPTWLDLTLAGGLLLVSLLAGFAIGSRLAAACDRWLLPLRRWARRHAR